MVLGPVFDEERRGGEEGGMRAGGGSPHPPNVVTTLLTLVSLHAMVQRGSDTRNGGLYLLRQLAHVSRCMFITEGPGKKL